MRQLVKLGYARSTVADWREAGRLHPVHRGVFAVGHHDLTWHGRCMAAVLAASPALVRKGHVPIVASHLAAGWLWDVLRYQPETIHVTVPKPRRSRRSYVVHEAKLAAPDRTVREGIPTTSLARTLLDLAAELRPEPLGSVLQRMEERKLLDLGPIDELLRRVPGEPGAASLQKALAIYRPEPAFTRSNLEKRFLGLVRDAGLPLPSTNYIVGSHELDAYWPEHRFAVELDVFETHGSRLSFEEDRKRDEDLLLLGIATTRVTGPRLDTEPAAVLERLSRLLRERTPS